MKKHNPIDNLSARGLFIITLMLILASFLLAGFVGIIFDWIDSLILKGGHI